jgi:hypothetical protein
LPFFNHALLLSSIFELSNCSSIPDSSSVGTLQQFQLSFEKFDVEVADFSDAARKLLVKEKTQQQKQIKHAVMEDV